MDGDGRLMDVRRPRQAWRPWSANTRRRPATSTSCWVRGRCVPPGTRSSRTPATCCL